VVRLICLGAERESSVVDYEFYNLRVVIGVLGAKKKESQGAQQNSEG
jgi:hypothetical protein